MVLAWLHMQLNYDLWHAQKLRRPKIEPLARRAISG
jgi:plasmid maintenance system antidote protein VapI